MQETTSLLKTGEQELSQLIVFRTGNEEFCVPIDAVQEIIKIGHITPIPDAPPFMRGLINVRGDIVAIIDVKAQFCLANQGDNVCKHIIITKQPTGLYGLMVDEVLEVLRVKKTDINTTSSNVNNIHEKYVNGVVVYDNRLIILLDLASVLSQNEPIKLSEITREFGKKTGDSAIETPKVHAKPPKKKQK